MRIITPRQGRLESIYLRWSLGDHGTLLDRLIAALLPEAEARSYFADTQPGF